MVGITQKPYLGRCCVVWIRQHVERHVPVSATDLEFDPNELSPIPLSVASIRQLLHVFDQVTRASEGEEANGNQARASVIVTGPHTLGGDDPALAGVDPLGEGSATPSVADDRACLPGAGFDVATPSGERGER
jgi:hypothetical protein